MRLSFSSAAAILTALGMVIAISISSTAYANQFFFASTSFVPAEQGSNPVAVSSQHSTGGFDLNGGAHASPGSVGARAQAHFFQVGNFSGDIELAHSSQARMIIDDIVISGPAGEIPVSLNLVMSGHISAEADAIGATAFSTGIAFASASFSGVVGTPEFFGIAGLTSFFGSMQARQREGNDFPNVTEVMVNGIFGSVDSDSSSSASLAGTGFTTDVFMAEVDEPLAVEFLLNVTAAAGFDNRLAGERSVTAEGVSVFGNTISFATSGPVFNLPPGYTVNSVQAGIVDNRFGPQQVVPEPGSLALFALGLIGLGLGRRLSGR